FCISVYLLVAIVVLFPYTTLFRSLRGVRLGLGIVQVLVQGEAVGAPVGTEGDHEHLAARRGACLAELDGRAGIGLGAIRRVRRVDRESTRLDSSHVKNSYALFCFK